MALLGGPGGPMAHTDGRILPTFQHLSVILLPSRLRVISGKPQSRRTELLKRRAATLGRCSPRPLPPDLAKAM